MRIPTLALLLFSVAAAAAEPPRLATREMNDLNWMEFKRILPSRVDTVLVTVGTMEPHGVINSGADNTAPIAIARAIAEDVNALGGARRADA